MTPPDKDTREAFDVVYLPVICQNGHKALATYKWDNFKMEFVSQGVPPNEQCDCPKSDLGEGYSAVGLPFIFGHRPKVSLYDLVNIAQGASNDAFHKVEEMPTIYYQATEAATQAILNHLKEKGVQFDEQD